MQRQVLIGYFVTILAGLSFGGIPIIVALLRDAGTSFTEQAFLRLFLGGMAGVLILLLYLIQRKDNFRASLTKNAQQSYIWQGLVFTIAIIVYIGSIILETPVGEAALLIQIHPLITLILGALLLKEEINQRKIVAIIFAFLGMIILTQPWEWQFFLTTIVGDLLASLNGIFYAIYLLIGAYSVQIRSKIPFYVSISWILFWGFIWGITIFIFLRMLPLPSAMFVFSSENILNPYILSLGLLLAILGSIIPYGLIMLSNKFEIESSTQSILLLGEPIAAAILGFLFLSEPITIWYIVGGVPMLVGMVIILRSAIEKSSTD